jgi:hypothetical protein
MCWPRVGEANPLFSVCITLWRWTATATLSIQKKLHSSITNWFWKVTAVSNIQFGKSNNERQNDSLQGTGWWDIQELFSVHLSTYRRQIVVKYLSKHCQSWFLRSSLFWCLGLFRFSCLWFYSFLWFGEEGLPDQPSWSIVWPTSMLEKTPRL